MCKFNDQSSNLPLKFSEITKEITDDCSIIFFKNNSVMRRVVKHSAASRLSGGLHEGERKTGPGI